MGVTYKLRDEIVEFILRQKHENPQISCRKLVIAIKENFSLDVSKSSINAVIKDAHLSSPVGRTPADLSRKKKFSIPKEKKVQLFGDPVSLLEQQVSSKDTNENFNCPISAPLLPAESKVNNPDRLVKNEEKLGPALSQSIQEEKRLEGELPADVILNPPPPEEKDEKVTLQEDVVGVLEESSAENFEINDMTPLFMRMALWEFFSTPLLEEFFKRHTSLGEQEIRILDVLACFSPGVFENPSVALDPQNRWLWKLHGWVCPPDKDEIDAIVNFALTTKIPKFDYLLELGYFCSMVSRVKLTLSDKQEIFSDGRFLFIDSGGACFFPFCPVERAVEKATRFIEGQGIFVSRCVSEENFKSVLDGVAFSFSERKDNPIRKITLMGPEDKLMLEFSYIPPKKRAFILSVAMSSERFESIFGHPLNFNPDQTMDRAGTKRAYIDRSVEISGYVQGQQRTASVRIVAFNFVDFGFVEVCVTNIAQPALSAKGIEAELAWFHPTKFQNEPSKLRESYPESLFESNDSEIVVVKAITNLCRLADWNLTTTFLQLGNDEEFVVNSFKSIGYIDFLSRSIKIGFKTSESINVEMHRKFLNSTNIYRGMVYDGKRISFIY